MLENGDLDPYFAIACVGGDGPLHYTFTALMMRGIRIPVFCIPAGHGVGVASSILADASPLVAAFSIAKGFRRNLDLIEVTKNDKLMCYGCLVIAWGLVADVEFNTASIRWLGPVRYRVGAIASVGKPPLFHLRISYIPSNDQNMAFCTGEGCVNCNKNNNADEEEFDESSWIVEEGHFIMVTAMNMSDSTANHKLAPYAHPSDGNIDLTFVKDISRAGLLELLTTIRTGSFVDKSNFNRQLEDKMKYVKVKKFKVEPLSGNEYTCSVDGIPYSHKDALECTVFPSMGTLGA